MTYWDNKGTHNEIADKLHTLIPLFGPSDKGPALEVFRVASNAYYDIFNNGGINRHADIKKLFGPVLRLAKQGKWVDIHVIVEPKMDAIILEAAREQGILP